MRRLPITLGTLALAVALSITGAHAQETVPLRTQMSAEEFRAAGLDKLSATELAALDAWLRRRDKGNMATPAVPVAHAQPADAASTSIDAIELERIREQARQKGRQEVVEENRGFFAFGSNEPIEATLVGEFAGFGKGNRYTLANGQVWEQTDAARLAGVRRTAPRVSIKPGMLNAWYMKIEGYNTSAKVQRIK